MMTRKQKLMAVRVTTGSTGEEPRITPLTGEPLDDVLKSWRILQMEGLGPQGGEGYTALLLLEELPAESRGGPLGFSVD
jgi:hypothetical protein